MRDSLYISVVISITKKLDKPPFRAAVNSTRTRFWAVGRHFGILLIAEIDEGSSFVHFSSLGVINGRPKEKQNNSFILIDTVIVWQVEFSA